MAFRVTLFFNQQSSKLGGWTENYWNNNSDLSAVTVAAQALRLAVWNPKGNQIAAPSIRISTFPGFRQVSNVIFPPFAGAMPAANDADYPTTKLLLKMRTTNGASTTQWFGGLRDTQIANSGNYVPSGTASASMNALYALLTSGANGWSIYVLDPARPKYILTAFDGATGTCTTPANTLANNSKVRVQGTKGLTGLNGIWNITTISNTQFTLNHWKPTTEFLTRSNAFVRPQTYQFFPISTVVPVRSTSHRVGKPGGLLGGRRRRAKT